MSTEKHTQGELKAYPIELRYGLPYTPIAINTLIAKVYSESFGDHLESEANARRIAACWNAFDGMSTDTIEQMVNVPEFFIKQMELLSLRDELLGALKKIASSDHDAKFAALDMKGIANAAIAKATVAA